MTDQTSTSPVNTSSTTAQSPGKTEQAKADIKEVAGSVANDAKKTAVETKNYVTSQLSEVKNEVTTKAEETVKKGRNRVSSQVGGVASAFHQASEQLRQENHQELAGYTRKIGDQVKGVADYLGERDMREVVQDIEGFARRQPAAFVGASLALGMVAARFMKSSRPDEVR